MSTLKRWALPSVLLMVTLCVALPILLYPMGRDQAMYGNIGQSILAGGTPYVDMWDIKPPPIYYLYAGVIALFGPTTWAVRLLDFFAVPLVFAVMVALGERLTSRRVGILAGVLFAVFYLTEAFPSLSQSDSLVTAPMSLAAVCAYLATQSPRGTRTALAWSLMCGLLCGVIVWFKQYYLFFVLALALNQALTRRAFPFREAVAFTLGGLLTGGGLWAYFYAQGMWAEMLLVAEGTAAYNAQGYDLAAFVASMQNYLLFRWWHWGPVLVLAALWLPLRLVGPRSTGWRLVVLWMLSGLAFALIQAKGFDTHWIPMLPPLALMAADALDRLITLAAKLIPKRAIVGVYGVVFVALWGILAYNTWLPAYPYMTGQASQAEYYAHFQANDLKPAESLAVVEYLQSRVAVGDTLFVWGFRPEIAYMGRWRPATRFQAHFPLIAEWYPPAWKQENVDILWAALPPYVLVLQADYMPWVTGRHEDSHELLQEYTELNNWLAYNYERVDKIGNFFIWHRRNPN